MSNQSDKDGDEELTVSVVLTGEYIELFKNSAFASGRTNRREATIRLKDSLEQYSAIASIGNRIPKDI
ncbi:TraY domain-containing protein [Vibrio coralliilyticus]|uniref:TraY domain-containing protein n=1 Tax=Vibrio coralliilyticus TaxID=190893 RepID=UPI000C170C85|nr:TraY domain-containing protein [Vibrio coralliilyticus]